MYYRINVAQNGKHYFCTGETLTDRTTAWSIYKEFLRFYPADLYTVTVSLMQVTGTDVTDYFANWTTSGVVPVV